MNTQTLIQAGALAALCATTLHSPAQTGGWYPGGHTNGPPTVRIVTPQEGQDLLLGRNIHICAVSLNFTDAVATVDFFAGTNLLGVVTNGSLFGFPQEFTCFTWSNAAAGAYTLLAKAVDVAGNSVTSAPVDITVVSNLPPLVHIVKPHNDEAILGPTNIMICASAFDPDGTIASASFFEGTNLLGVVTNSGITWVTNHYGGVFPVLQSLYCLTWSNVALGTHSLTVEATDNQGASATSAPVVILGRHQPAASGANRASIRWCQIPRPGRYQHLCCSRGP